MTTPTRFIERYLARRAKLSAAPGSDAVGIVGYLDAKRCACGSTRKGEVWNDKARAWVMRCARCGRAWERRKAYVPRAAIQGGRRADPDAALAELATWRLAIESLSEYERRVMLAYATWRGPGRADSGIAALGRERWREAPFAWTQHRVRQLIRSAEAQLEREIERRGLN